MKDDRTAFATFEMPVNMDMFTDLFRVQQGPCTRKLGILRGALCSIMAALSCGDEIGPIDGRMPFSRMVLDRSSDTYCEPRSL